MILFADVSVKSLFELGRRYEWAKERVCPACGARLWGHGFVSAWFDGCSQAVWLPRYRCSACRLVIKVRPAGYWSRFQASIAEIRESLSHRLSHLRWPSGRSPSRQRHWLNGLKKQVRARLGMGWAGDLLQAFDELCRGGFKAASRAV